MAKISPFQFISRVYRKRIPAGTRVQKIGFLFIYWKDFNIHVSLWGEVEAKGRKKYFSIDGNVSSEQMYALLKLNNVNSDNEEETDNLINDSETGFIGDEEILPANNTLNTLLATPEANIHLIRDNEESKKAR